MRLRVVVFVALVVAGIGLTGIRSPHHAPTAKAVWPVVAAKDDVETAAAASAAPVSVPTTLAPTPTTTAPPAPPTTTTTAPIPVPTAMAAAAPVRNVSVYNGLGTWIDVYDWSVTYGKDGALVTAATVDDMARAGVQTLYVQTSKWDAPTDVLEPDRLLPIIDRANALGLRVIAWYLPTFEDPQRDMGRIMAASRLAVDAVAVDIESLKMKDVDERNRRLIEISTNLRAALPDVALAAIPFPPVAMDVINPRLWPSFPWAELAPLYDVWMPMSYQSERKPESGYRDGYRYTAENIDRLRAHLGNGAAPVHSIGGIADRTSPEDIAGMHRASLERGALGGSLYDWRTTAPDLWAHLQVFRS